MDRYHISRRQKNFVMDHESILEGKWNNLHGIGVVVLGKLRTYTQADLSRSISQYFLDDNI